MTSRKNQQELCTPIASRVLSDGRLVELILDSGTKKTTLAIFDGTEVTFANDIAIEGGQRLVPISASNSLIRHQAIVLPEAPEAYGDVDSLVAEIESYIARYLSVSDGFRRLAAYYILFSWVYDAFEEVPYIRVQAEWGSGKTRALIVIGSLCYRAFLASGASTVSPIFHTLDTFRGTLVLDEADFRLSDQTTELTKILNNGNVRGFPVFRTAITQKREFDPRAFQVFGPKLVAMRGSFNDEALESRFITERLDAVPMEPHIPINLPASQRQEALTLRNKLLRFRFDRRLDSHADDALVDPALSPRANQILVPLLSIIPDAAARTEVKQAVADAERMRRASRSRTVEADVLEIVVELAAASDRPIPLSDICTRFADRYHGEYDRPLSSRYIGNILRTRLGLFSYKSHGTYAVVTDHERLTRLAERFGVESESR
jgi:hypothetical protein